MKILSVVATATAVRDQCLSCCEVGGYKHPNTKCYKPGLGSEEDCKAACETGKSFLQQKAQVRIVNEAFASLAQSEGDDAKEETQVATLAKQASQAVESVKLGKFKGMLDQIAQEQAASQQADQKDASVNQEAADHIRLVEQRLEARLDKAENDMVGVSTKCTCSGPTCPCDLRKTK
eukprot:CAMPEP_0204278226 /NCGR_PEP_ID=MMETSP0468-20130131/29747_1 /ASSEMBLY_ACC=CAM_ASM_000383 /TAXON_ID=2969 /ORGANISM="Oxyrrhis marina" /LENGTH=176 /DNA_ID=CAMNT_0051255105 /DNA_START=32 /DNA_END=562 /DNA_ORIENTATION=-